MSTTHQPTQCEDQFGTKACIRKHGHTGNHRSNSGTQWPQLTEADIIDAMSKIKTKEPSNTSSTPRYDANDQRNASCVADVLADLTDQVARIANALEYSQGVDPRTFPNPGLNIEAFDLLRSVRNMIHESSPGYAAREAIDNLLAKAKQ
jgi:hypothetical protein